MFLALEACFQTPILDLLNKTVNINITSNYSRIIAQLLTLHRLMYFTSMSIKLMYRLIYSPCLNIGGYDTSFKDKDKDGLFQVYKNHKPSFYCPPPPYFSSTFSKLRIKTWNIEHIFLVVCLY